MTRFYFELMSIILTTTLVLGAVGLVCGVALAVVAKKFAVPENPLVAHILAALPGANCGGCGFPGCDGYAHAVAESGAPLTLCTACTAEMLAELERITGRKGGEVAERKVALVRCAGDFDAAKRRFDYNGLADCASVQSSNGGDKSCLFGCLGYGTCERICPNKAITVVNGLARVDPAKCVGCGACVRGCPRHVIELVPVSHTVHVLCNSPEKGPVVKKVCNTGCLGCGLCSRLDKSGSFVVKNNLAGVDYAKPPSPNAALVAEKCPAKCIVVTSTNG